MKAPQIIYTVLIGINLLCAAHLHGKPRENPNWSFWSPLISAIIFTSLLMWGGFFS